MNISKINETIKNLNIEAVEDKNQDCWAYADDPSAKNLFGFDGKEFSKDTKHYYNEFKLKRSAHTPEAWWVVLS